MINLIDSEVQTGNIDACAHLLDDLLAASEKHFSEEEAYLEQVEYNGLAQHRVYHSELLRKARGMRALCAGETDVPTFATAFEDMSAFLLADVIAGDLEFVRALRDEPRSRLRA